MEPEHINLIRAKLQSGEAIILHSHDRVEWWTEEELPLQFHHWKRSHPFQVGDNWAAPHILDDAMTMVYDENGVPHITIDADVQFIHSGRGHAPDAADSDPWRGTPLGRAASDGARHYRTAETEGYPMRHRNTVLLERSGRCALLGYGPATASHGWL